jgi:bla regulator protein blaR1
MSKLSRTFNLGLFVAAGLLAQSFDAASVKQHQKYTNADFHLPAFLPGGRFTSTAPLDMVIAAAWRLPYHSGARLSGGPNWIRSDDGIYDIDAKAEKGAIPDSLPTNVRADSIRPMLQKLLAHRFHLTVHRETREMPIYAVIIAKGGPNLAKADIEEKDCAFSANLNLLPGDSIVECHMFVGGRGRGLHARAANLSDLVQFVEGFTDRPVIDQTGLAGLYRFNTSGWSPLEPGPPPAPGAESEDGTTLSDLPSIFQIFDSLGLKLEARKGMADVIVIDHIERPVEN